MTTNPEIRAAAAAFVSELIATCAEQDAASARNWLVEIVDPALPDDDPNHRTFLGPFTDERDALAETDRYEREVNPQVATDGYPALIVAVRPMRGPDQAHHPSDADLELVAAHLLGLGTRTVGALFQVRSWATRELDPVSNVIVETARRDPS
jgi:hypothetical protein